jgi:hypothetical protein
VRHCRGQVTDANLVGTVLDSSGSAIPNAQVRLVNTATRVEVAASTEKDGSYCFLNLPSGTYAISASAEGFGAVSIKCCGHCEYAAPNRTRDVKPTRLAFESNSRQVHVVVRLEI